MASDSEDEQQRPAQRRASGRVRKAVDRLGAGPKDAQDDGSETDELEQDSGDEGHGTDFESDDNEVRPRKTTTTKRARAKSQSGVKRGKGRPRRAGTQRGGAGGGGDDEEQADEGAATGGRGADAKGDFKINNDNAVFNAVRNPNTALESTVNDWIESYQESPGPAMAELVDFLLRCCGCNSSVDEHQAEDENGIVETLTDVTDEFKHESNLAHPLVSRSKTYKKFRSSLASFLSRLYRAAATSEILYDTPFSDLVQAWILVLSSSKIRAFRHTATVIALLSVSALNEVHIEVTKEQSQASRAKEAEEKKGRKDKARLKELTKNVQRAAERQKKVEDLINESYESVFVNRYRDSDAVIRAECIGALGNWMKANSDYWLEGDYLRYIGWVLSDEAKEARRESIKALFSLYAKESNISSLRHFTERFKNQLTHMAVGEVDLTVRVQAIHVLRQIESHGLLDEEQRDEVAKLIFEKEKRVRNAAADFFAAVHKEQVTERETAVETASKKKKGSSATDQLDAQDQLQLKVLAELLLHYGKALDGDADGGNEGELDDDATLAKKNELSGLVESKDRTSRVASAVEALWDKVEAVRDWQRLTEYLLLDHSSEHTKKNRKKGAEVAADSSKKLVDACRLSEEEETILIEVLVNSLETVKAHATAAATKKEQEEQDETLAEMTQYMVNVLPDLFARHQTIPARVIDILAIPRVLSLELYAEANHRKAYETMWDDVTKQFMNHKDAQVLDQAVKTISVLLETAALPEVNETKMTELQAGVANALRAVVSGKEIESAAFEEDELLILTSTMTRIDKLLKAQNLVEALEDTEDEQHTSAWDIVDSVVDRGMLGYRDEATMIAHGIGILGTHFVWQLSMFIKDKSKNDMVDATALAVLVERRDKLMIKLEEIAVGASTNANQSVKQAALTTLLDIHVLCESISSPARDPDGQLSDLRAEMSDELQSRCAGFIEAELERYSEELSSLREQDQEGGAAGSDESGSETDTGTQKSKKKGSQKSQKQKETGLPKRKSPQEIRAANKRDFERLLAARRFEQVIHPFVRALHAGSLDLQHATVLLSRYEHFGAGYDHWCKLIIQDLRDEGIYSTDGAASVVKVILATLKSATELYIDSLDESASDDKLVALGRALVPATVVRGAQLAIVRKMSTDELVSLHTQTIDFIVPKIATYGEDRRTTQRNRSLALFKALTHLVLGVQGKAALTIKNHLDSVLGEHEVEVSQTSKTWEPVRAYKKRLITAMSKDASLKQAAEAKAAKATKSKAKADASAAENANDDDDELEYVDAVPFDEEQAAAAPRPTKSQVTPGRRKRTDKTKDDEEDGTASALKRRRTSQKASRADEEAEGEDEDEVQSLLVGRHKSSPLERANEDEDEEEEEDQDAEDETRREVGDEEERPAPPSPSSQISLSDVRRRKKKARR
ncbi:hypothetical protein ACM66B_004862 [Microbotryomycetes sp. NB124-2]